ncbi:MAG: hypothetical protein V4737_10705, partial [Curtobacterium sp.]
LVADFAGNGVLRRDPDGTWSVVAPFGTDDRAMWNPSALTETDRGTVLVAEAGRQTVAELDGHDVVRRFPAPGDRAVSGLASAGTTLFAAVPGSGSLWATDTDTAAGWSSVAGPWVDPSGVAVSLDGSTLTVSDQSTDTVWQVDRATGAVSSLGSPGDDPARVRPRGVAVLEDGSVVVADNGGGRVFVRQDGVWSVAFSSAPDGSPLVNPTGVSVGPNGRIAVADYNQRRVVEAARAGGAEPVPGASESPGGEASAGPTGEPTSAPTSVPTSAPTSVPTPSPSAPASGRPTPAPGDPAPEPTASTGPTSTPEPSAPSTPAPEPSAVPSGPNPPADTGDDVDTGAGSETGARSGADAAGGDPATPATSSHRVLATTGAGPVGLLALAAVLAITAGVLIRRPTRPSGRQR